MTYPTRQAVYRSLLEFTPALREAHHVIQLASGRWSRTLGAPSDVTDAIGRTLVAVKVRGREWRQTVRP